MKRGKSKERMFLLAALCTAFSCYVEAAEYSNTDEIYAGINHLGYGFVGSSEAELANSLDFSCDEVAKQKYLNDVACLLTSNSKPPKIDNEILRPFFIQMVRDKLWEFRAIQITTLTNGKIDEIPTPACVSKSSENRDEIKTAFMAITSSTDESEPLPSHIGNYVAKIKAVNNTFSSKNALSAVLNYKKMNFVKSKKCKKIYKSNLLFCENLNQKINVLKESYGYILNSQVGMSRIAKLVEKTLPNGKNAIAKMINGSEDSVDKLFDKFQEKASQNARMPTSLTSSPSGDLDEIISDVKETYAVAIARDIEKICEFDEEEMIQKAPQIIRQLYNDQDAEGKIFTKNLVCNSAYFEKKRNNQTECFGVKKIGNVVHVKRQAPDWPYNEDLDYDIVINNDGSLSVKTNVLYVAGAGMSKTAVKKLASQWQQNVNEFYNSTALRFENLFDKKIKFDVGMKVIAEEDSKGKHIVKIHKCYNMELKGSNKTNCKKVELQGGNRADSGNYYESVDSGTVRHEIGHLLGLDDEYEDDADIARALGEKDSIMRTSYDDSSKFYPRHFEKIIAPVLKCAGKK